MNAHLIDRGWLAAWKAAHPYPTDAELVRAAVVGYQLRCGGRVPPELARAVAMELQARRRAMEGRPGRAAVLPPV